MPSNSPYETDETRGMTLRELVLEMRHDFRDHVIRHDNVHTEIDAHIADRPSRKEILSLFAGAGTLSGIVFAAVRFF